MATTVTTDGHSPLTPVAVAAAAVSPDAKSSVPDQYHACRKVETLFDVSDMLHNAGTVLFDEIRPIIAKDNISKSDRTKCLRRLQLVSDILLGAQRVVKDATFRISPLVKGSSRAHDIAKKEKKRRIQDALLSTTRRSADSKPIMELKLFQRDHIDAISQPKVMVLDSSGTGTVLPLLGPSTRSAASTPAPILRLPMPQRGAGAMYSPQEILAWLMAEEKLIEEKKSSKEKGARIMASDFKAAKQYLVDKHRVEGTADNLNRLLRVYRDRPGDAPRCVYYLCPVLCILYSLRCIMALHLTRWSSFHRRVWGEAGRKRVAEPTEIIDTLTQSLSHRTGGTFGKKEVEAAIIASRKRQMSARNLPVMSEDQLRPNRVMVQSFTTAIANDSAMAVIAKVRVKSRGREIAEKSLRSTSSFHQLVAHSDVVLGSDGLQLPGDAPEGCKLFRDLVVHANGGVDVSFILPGLKINTDDCTIFLPGPGADDIDEDEVRLAFSSQIPDSGSYSFHRMSSSSSAKFEGILVRQTVSISLAGKFAPVCFAIPGFSESQIPKDKCEDGIVPLAIPGLCIGGNLDVENETIGYIVLLRADKGIDVSMSGQFHVHLCYYCNYCDCYLPSHLTSRFPPTKILMQEKYFQWYDNKIRSPFVDSLRIKLYDLAENADSIPRRLQSSLTTDGGIPQILANTKECVLDRHRAKNNVIGKLAAGCSATTQECDINSKGFRSTKRRFKALNRTSPLTENTPSAVQSALELAKNQYGLQISSQDKANIGRLALRAPEALTKSYDSASIKAAGVRSGRIDAKYHTYPDLHKMIGTLKRQLVPGELELLTDPDKFAARYAEFGDAGVLSEALLDQQGFPLDSLDGVPIPHTATTAQEHCQRCKILSNPRQIAERAHAAKMAREKAILKDQRASHQLNQDIENNQEAEVILHTLAGRPPQPNRFHARRHLTDSTLDHFGSSTVKGSNNKSLTGKYLKAFAKARKEGFKSSTPVGKLDKVKAAIANKEANVYYDPDDLHCLIHQCYLLRSEPLLPAYRSAVSAPNHAGSEGDVPPETIADVLPRANDVVGKVQVEEIAPDNIELWIELMGECFVGVEYQYDDEVGPGMLCQAKALLPVVFARLNEQKNDRLPAHRKFHFTMEFVLDNLYRMCIQHASRRGFPAGVASSDIRSADVHSTCLIGSPAKAKLVSILSDEMKKRKGGYIEYQDVKKQFRRSGQTIRTFVKRWGEHVKASKLLTEADISSDHYFLFADEKVEIDPMIRKIGGTFQQLHPYVSLAFSDVGEEKAIDAKNGPFYWSKSVLNALENSNTCRGDVTKRKLAMVSCLIEVFHGLLMSPDRNVSLNPSFEHELGVNNHGKK